jgi:predicted ATPase/DNA-binding CsgD family transcriptional regulator
MAVTTSTRRRHNLPVDFTSFVGREREIPAIKRLLGDARLVTLTGPGGVGKTRLAVRAANDLQRGFRDGVWLVELAGLHDTALVPQTLTAALGVQGTSDRGPLDSLVDFLQPRQLLLVLDNCEHLVNACARLVETLLRSCPELSILATSRQLLHVDGEHVLPVPPLPVPDSNLKDSPDGLGRYAAVRLFVERAAAVDPGFTIDQRNQQAVTEICQRLDGIPLAIELAASRLRVLSAHQLQERLDDRYGLLTGGSPAALPRQKTLRALIDWSFELCSPAEQLLWSRLSVFGDGFELDAAEAVCSDDHLDAADVFDVLAGLVDKSIITAERHDQRVRYHLSETLREYGHERLPEAEEHLLRHRHRDWCADLVARAAAGWFTPEQVALFTRLRREHANIRAALGFCLNEPGEAHIGLGMASLLRFYWLMSGRLAEGRHWLDRLLDRHPARDLPRLRALRVDGHVAALLNDYAAADALLEEACELAAELDDPSATAYVTQACGLSALFQGDATAAAALLAEALEQHQALDDGPAIAYDQVQLALATVFLGDHARALDLIEDALRTCEPSGEHWTTSLALFALGVEACRKGDQDRAVDAGRRSIELRLPLEDKRSIGLSFEALAWSAAAVGDGVRSARLFGASQAIQKSTGTSLRALGHLSELHEQYETVAREALGEAGFEREVRAGELLDFDEAVDYALGVDKPADERASADPAAAAGLTRREREIAELVAQGMSNREIAASLVISQRTAEGHVEHILAKLNFSSRAQVAVWVAENRSASG